MEANTAIEQVEQDVYTPMKLDVSVRPVEPKGNLIGFASVKFNDAFVVDDFKVLQNENGLFVGMPSKPDQSSKTGYRNTARPITADFRAELTEAISDAYYAAVEKLQARAAAVADKPRIADQMEKAGQEAAEHNAAKPALDKSDKPKSAEL